MRITCAFSGVNLKERSEKGLAKFVDRVKLRRLFFPHEEPQRCAGESVRFTQLILQVPEVGGCDVARMTDK